MKKLIVLLTFITAFNVVHAQWDYLKHFPRPSTEYKMFKYYQPWAFPTTDSLRTYNTKWITNNAATAFTNLRLHYLIDGIIDFLDTALNNGGGSGNFGIDSLSKLNDTTLRYRKNGVFRTLVFKGQAETLQQVFNNGSVLSENETITILDSLRFVFGKVILDTLKIRGLQTVTDTSLYKPLVTSSSNEVFKFSTWPYYNIMNASLTANGDYIQNVNNFDLRFDSIDVFTLFSQGALSNRLRFSSIRMDANHVTEPLAIRSDIYKINSSVDDSITNVYRHFNDQIELASTNLYANYRAGIVRIGHTGSVSLSAQAGNVLNSRSVVLDTTGIKIGGAIPAASADSIAGFGPYDPVTGTNAIYKIPASGISSSVLDSLKYFYVDFSVGDSVTDATTTIQNAINRAKAAGGGKVKIPRGKYRTTATLIIDTSKIVIEGSGAGTEIWAATDFGDIFYFRPSVVPATIPNVFHDIGIRDISIQSAVARTTGYAIRTNYTHSATVENVVIGWIRTTTRDSITPFYMGVSFENESNFKLSNSQIYAWKKGVYITGKLVGAFYKGTNSFDGLITGNTFILGDTTKWHVLDSTYGIHLAGGIGGVQFEAGNNSFYTRGVQVDKTGNGETNYDLFLKDGFVADNMGEMGVYIAPDAIYSLNMAGSWISAVGNSVPSYLLYLDTGNIHAKTYVSGGSFHDSYNGTVPGIMGGNGFYIGDGTFTMTGAQFYNNGGNGSGVDLTFGPQVDAITVVGNSFERSSGNFINHSGLVPTLQHNHNLPDSTATTNVIYSKSTTGTPTYYATNNIGKSVGVGIYGSAATPYGAIDVNGSYVYANGVTGLTILSEDPSGPIKFTAGGNTEKMRLTPTGRLGIGTSNPDYSLHISGSSGASLIRALLENTNSDNIVTTTYDVKNNDAKILNFGLSSSTYSANAFIGANSGFLYNDAPGGLGIYLGDASSNFRVTTGGGTERFRIASNGDVTVVSLANASAGIATTTTTGLLGRTTSVPVANGGTGNTSFTAYAPVFGGTTSTGALQQTAIGTAGQVLTSNGAGAVATFQTLSLNGSTTHDFGTIGNNSSATTTITVTGAADGDFVVVTKPVANGWSNGETYTAWVSGANTVTLRQNNNSGGSAGFGSQTINVKVIKQ